jgi:ATPase subunit of ABC transporter with duplicated ATPase domains
LSLHKEDRVGLIGINGVGKSSLLKIFSKEIKAFDGSITTKGKIASVLQIQTGIAKSDTEVFSYIQNIYNQWWDVLEILELRFGHKISPNRKVNSLSGGELSKLHIATALAQKPDFLLLDEPTNHLDIKSADRLIIMLKEFPGGIITVSHDKYFLNKLTNKTWLLENGNLQEFGGNYDFYKQALQNQENAKARKLEAKQKELNKLKKAKKREEKRVTNSYRTGRKLAHKGGTDGFAQTYFTDKSQKRAGQRKNSLDDKHEKLKSDIAALKAEKRATYSINFNSKKLKGRIFTVKNANLKTPDGRMLINDFNLDLRFGDRLLIAGNNGTGKTLLIKNLMKLDNSESLIKGEIKKGQKKFTFTYLNQNYEIVNLKKTVLENVQATNTALNNDKIRRVLGGLGFFTAFQINQPASTLSGGETARLALAMAITKGNSNILVLDEPTNNLDIFTKETISEALTQYNGTLILISHDISFIKELNINKGLKIQNQKLNKLNFNENFSDEEIKQILS